MTTDEAPRPAEEAQAAGPADGGFVPPPERLVKLSLVCVVLSMFLAAMSQTVVATTLPLMVADLGGFERYTQVATSYMVAATIAYPIVGRLSDLYGRKRFLVGGMAVFVVGSALVAASASMTQVVAFRAVQGIGGGILMTCCYIAIADLFAAEQRGRFHGLIGAAFGVAFVAGPILGGFVAERLSWAWAFILIALAGIPVLILTARVYPAHRRVSDPPKPDVPGMVVLVLALVPLLLAVSQAGADQNWDSPYLVVPLVFGLAMTGVFVVIETRASAPIMPLGLYADRVVGMAVILTLLTSLGLYASVLFLPLFFQVVLGVSATASGNLLAPMLLGMVAGGIVVGRILARADPDYRRPTLACAGLMTVGTVLLSTMSDATSLVACEIYIVLAGVGFGGSVATLSLAVQNSVPFALVGTATSALQFFRSLGGMLGLAVLGAVMAGRFSQTLDETVPERVREALPPGGLDALADHPAAIVDPASAEALASRLAESGPDGGALAATLLDAMASALTGALDDVFSIVAAVTALSFVAALFFRVPARPPAEHEC